MTDPDPMDTRLRAYADRWRHEAAPAPVVDTQRLGRTRNTRTLSLVLGSAAVIALVIFGATHLVDSDAPAKPAPALTSPGRLPTAASSPTRPPVPVETTPFTRKDALRRALAADPAVRADMLGGLEPQGPVVCGMHVMDSSPDGRTLYMWLGCADYAVFDGAAIAVTGSDEPAVVQVRGSGTDIQVEKVTFPRQQSLAADIKRLFPPRIAEHIYDEKSTRMSPSAKELEAEAVAAAG